ncbi:antibiotic biosynthesis monooxygenase [Muricauda sp. MAR_2010_75]|jgi:heme-degrading monooxygenase HmoA|uniref:antibiotic biosynthesis monooxygenase family protein n=1 Tax=Allomuricauda sp. MAR_2010_75 TaxID=1250232 RepID=UPI00056CEC4C|nr:antibiotic biosynthesis monooxygenase [Muricauda sp. MAR_2010_75]
MIAVLFEAFVTNGKWEDYLELASKLKTELNQIEGFIAVERFQSLTNPEKVLSLSLWKDEVGIMEWHCNENHQEAQFVGRTKIFKDYNIKIASIDREYSKKDR